MSKTHSKVLAELDEILTADIQGIVRKFIFHADDPSPLQIHKAINDGIIKTVHKAYWIGTQRENRRIKKLFRKLEDTL